jgi:hypothetical protein
MESIIHLDGERTGSIEINLKVHHSHSKKERRKKQQEFIAIPQAFAY